MSDLSKFIAAYSQHWHQQIQDAQHYIGKAGPFLGHMILDHPNEFITAVSTAVVAIFTYVLARSTKRLWITTRDAAAAQSAEMKASIAVTQQSANAAAISARAAADSVERLERAEKAYVWGGFGQSHGVRNAMTLGITNYGKTPALVTRVFARIRPLAGLPHTPEIGPEFDEIVTINYILRPGPDTLPVNEVIRRGPQDNIDCVFYGRIWYVDVFKNEHYSGFILHLRDDDRGRSVNGFPEYWEWT